MAPEDLQTFAILGFVAFIFCVVAVSIFIISIIMGAAEGNTSSDEDKTKIDELEFEVKYKERIIRYLENEIEKRESGEKR